MRGVKYCDTVPLAAQSDIKCLTGSLPSASIRYGPGWNQNVIHRPLLLTEEGQKSRLQLQDLI